MNNEIKVNNISFIGKIDLLKTINFSAHSQNQWF